MPHVCGDEPNGGRVYDFEQDVCPTYVGMNRQQQEVHPCPRRMPHVGGDEPNDALTPDQVVAYAPRM